MLRWTGNDLILTMKKMDCISIWLFWCPIWYTNVTKCEPTYRPSNPMMKRNKNVISGVPDITHASWGKAVKTLQHWTYIYLPLRQSSSVSKKWNFLYSLKGLKESRGCAVSNKFQSTTVKDFHLCCFDFHLNNQTEISIPTNSSRNNSK